ncbi:efflux RND transporter periplasmic adaptor subunit [Christensenellaceae bacterium OttesenSCG-928-L17]|nr:efflux RND transporter periplasmic adaptor subunit [Christensenellaceae bacterium OttesenSCG-928-L17]
MEQVVETRTPEYGEPLPASPEKEKKPKKKKRRIKARWIVLAVILVIIIVVFAMCRSAVNNVMSSLLAYDDTTVLTPTDLSYSIGATGTVVSANGRSVYSTQGYTVDELFVKVGDTVRAGDPLCKLDGSSLEKQIATKELSMELSAKSAQLQVQSARDSYKLNKDSLDNGTNASLISAQTQVDNAYNSWVKAQETYEQYKKGNDRGENSQILQAQANVRNALATLNQAKAAASGGGDYDQNAVDEAYAAWQEAEANLLLAQAAFDADSSEANATALVNAKNAVESTKATYQSLANKGSSSGSSISVATAQAAYDDAVAALNAAKRSANYTEDDYEEAIDTAYTAYENAKKSLLASEASAQQQLNASLNSYKSAQLSANNELAVMELAQLQDSLDETTITSPISGTVTAVYAKVGASGSGLLFVVEDTEHLLVETSVKEYDLGTVQAGMEVHIRSDSTGDERFLGTINNIAPASRKTNDGSIDTSGEVVFDTEVGVTSMNTGLRIGMSVRLDLIIESKEQVLCVPYEAVYTNAAGETCVLTLTPQEDGNFLIGELPVTTGMETDLDIEIYGEGVVSGVRVINVPGTYRLMIGQSIPLSEVSLFGGSGELQMGGGMRMGGGGAAMSVTTVG